MSDYRYVGEGDALPGGNVPARDLTDEELPEIAARRGVTVKELRRELDACGLYKGHGESTQAKTPRPARKAAKKAAPRPASKPAEAKADTKAARAPAGSVDEGFPSPLPTQTGPLGELVTPAPIEPKAP